MRFQILLIFLFAAVASFAQPKGNSTYAGLTQFLNTEFVQKFEQSRNKAEQAVRDFNRIKDEFAPEDVMRVMDAYNASAEQFNQVLYNIKADLLDRQKRKFIIQYPQDYSRQIETDLNVAKDYYQSHFQNVVFEVTGGRVSGMPFLALLPEIIKYGKIAFQIFQNIKAEIKKYNDSILEDHLIQPYRFHSWNELE